MNAIAISSHTTTLAARLRQWQASGPVCVKTLATCTRQDRHR